MKKLLLILLLLPLVSFGQQAQAQSTKVQVVNAVDYNIGLAAVADAMSDASTTIKVRLSINLKDYTHMAIVDVTGPTGKRGKAYFKAAYRGLLSSQLTIINPTSDKKKFKANSLYLRDTKNPKWLYLYLTGSKNGVDKSITTIIRDYENNIVYSTKTLNLGFYEVMANIANL